MISILSEIIAPVTGTIWLVGGAIILFLFGKRGWPRLFSIAAVTMMICGAIIVGSASPEVRLLSLVAGALIGAGLTLQAFRI